jgi:hypothetical protein
MAWRRKKMKMKTVATCSPIVLCLLAGAARADLEPFSFEASEMIKHESNILHASEGEHQAGWLSTTELQAAIDEVIGRQRLLGSAAVNFDRYSTVHARNSNGYTASGELDWNTVGDLSGAVGADSKRHQYLYGLDGDVGSGARNLQTDDHAFARAQLGGVSRWTIFTGFDATQRKYSDPLFDVEQIQQWAASGGSSYATTPDLSFGFQGRYARGKYPKVILSTGTETFSTKTAGINTKWTASGNSTFDANIGYTLQRIDGEPDQRYINGGLNWHWAPPSHFTITLGIARDGNNSTGTAANVINTNNGVTGRSLNTTGHLDVNYELTAKVGLDVLAEYIHRKYTDSLLPVVAADGTVTLVPATGATNTSRFTVSAHYLPTRNSTVTCGVSREIHSSDDAIRQLSGPYSDNSVMCTGVIHFN